MHRRGRALWITATVIAAAVVIAALAVIGKVYDDRRQADADERAAIRATAAIQSRIAAGSIQLEVLGDSIEATGAAPEAFEAASQSRPTDGSPLTASVGIAVFADLAAFTQETAMNAADLAMYEAKRAGGHGVGLWSS